ncbi:hypothetical protein PG994_009809 [Apiospora phragmitis]|uniref:Uncharacterized protein n=1 Tax=Apiospora phragmitis TaxID=2905665 RepID=A0ABR1U7Q3_9PEZI
MDPDEPARTAEGDVRYLYTTSLATCNGIAVSGLCPPLNATDDPSVVRYDRFMVHMSEELREENYGNLERLIQAAKNIGLHDLQVHIVAIHPDFQTSDDENLEDTANSYEAQRALMTRLRALVGSSSDVDPEPRIHWYPYRGDDANGFAKMALYSDRSVVVNHTGFGSVYVGDEKQWINMAVSKIPRPTSPPGETS